eukprot:jgi/Mesen1/6910/ME000354S06101
MAGKQAGLILAMVALIASVLALGANAITHPIDVAILEAIKAEIEFGNTTQLFNDADPCSGGWGMVTQCVDRADGYQSVVNLEMGGSSIKGGRLSDRIGDFPALASMSGALSSPLLASPALTNLGGPIPASINNLITLSYLEISNSNFTGSIPSFSNLKNAYWIALDRNRLTGTITDQFAGCKSLSHLSMINNLLEGPLPTNLGNAENLVDLLLGYNRLSGVIPDSFQNLISLTSFQIHNNNMSGAIPASLTTLPSLYYIDMSNNNLSGEIPALFESAKLITGRSGLLLANNSLTGPIPSSIDIFARKVLQTMSIDLSGNKLSGPVAPSLLQLASQTSKLKPGNEGLCGIPLSPACPPPSPPPPFVALQSPSLTPAHHKSSGLSTTAVVGIVLGLLALLAAMIGGFMVFLKKSAPPASGKKKDNIKGGKAFKSGFKGFGYNSDNESLSGKSCKSVASSKVDAPIVFEYEDLMEATEGFHHERLLGRGGFGHVYRGSFPDGGEVAVKVLNKAGNKGQGEKEYAAEVETISRSHHRHLVKLIGYCSEGAHRILVFEYIAKGSLAYHLHADKNESLPWNSRVKIAVGAAKGLAYLHEACVPRIVHRDIKPSNILIDGHFEAKISDFGLAVLVPDGVSAVTTRVLGTWGYVAPDYAGSEKVCEKADTFSFGMVLLEIISGKKPFGDQDLLEWVRERLRRPPAACHCFVLLSPQAKELHAEQRHSELVDPRMHGDYNAAQMESFLTLALLCLELDPLKRPGMGQVVRMLEGDMNPADFSPEATAVTIGGPLAAPVEEGDEEEEGTKGGSVAVSVPPAGARTTSAQAMGWSGDLDASFASNV